MCIQVGRSLVKPCSPAYWILLATQLIVMLGISAVHAYIQSRPSHAAQPAVSATAGSTATQQDTMEPQCTVASIEGQMQEGPMWVGWGSYLTQIGLS